MAKYVDFELQELVNPKCDLYTLADINVPDDDGISRPICEVNRHRSYDSRLQDKRAERKAQARKKKHVKKVWDNPFTGHDCCYYQWDVIEDGDLYICVSRIRERKDSMSVRRTLAASNEKLREYA